MRHDQNRFMDLFCKPIVAGIYTLRTGANLRKNLWCYLAGTLPSPSAATRTSFEHSNSNCKLGNELFDGRSANETQKKRLFDEV